jgi:TM2 domain-containing membrane protein YozV
VPFVRVIAVVVVGLLPAVVLAQEPGAVTLRLAEHLAALGRHDACAVEALRALHEGGPSVPCLDRASACLIQAGRADTALRLLTDRTDEPALRDRVCMLRATIAAASELPQTCTTTDIAMAQALTAERWTDARRLIAIGNGIPAPLQSDATSWLDRAAALPRPSPLLAAGLSAVLPGLGRVYVGKWQDGLVSFGLVGTPAWFAYDGFREVGVTSVRGWLLGTVAAVLYAGNVYGSYVGAEVMEREAREALTADVRRGLLVHAAADR